MANLVFDFGLARGKEFYSNARNQTPVNSTLVMVILASAGLETDAVLRVKTSLADVVSGTTNEATNTGYARRLISVGLAAVPAPDLVNHRWQCAMPQQTWVDVQNDGTGAWGKLIICYRNAAADPDTAIIPWTMHDFAVTPTGVTITAVSGSNGFFRAQAV